MRQPAAHHFGRCSLAFVYRFATSSEVVSGAEFASPSTTEVGKLFIQVVCAAGRELGFWICSIGYVHRLAVSDVLNRLGCCPEIHDRWFHISHSNVLLSSEFASLGRRGQSLSLRYDMIKDRAAIYAC